MEQYRQFQQLALVMKLVKGGPLFPWLLASLNHSETGLTKPHSQLENTNRSRPDTFLKGPLLD